MPGNRVSPTLSYVDSSDDEDCSDWSDDSSVSSEDDDRGSGVSIGTTQEAVGIEWLREKLFENDLTTAEGKAVFLAKMIMVAAVPLIALIVIATLNIQRSGEGMESMTATQVQMEAQAHVQAVVTSLQYERALVITHFYDETFAAESEFIKAYLKTDDAINNVTDSEPWRRFWYVHIEISSAGLFQYYIWKNRIGPGNDKTIESREIITFYASAVGHFIAEMTRKSLKLSSGKVGRSSSIGIVLTRANEAYGNIHALGCEFFSTGRINATSKRTIYQLRYFAEDIINGARQQSKQFRNVYDDMTRLDHVTDHLKVMLDSIQNETIATPGEQALAAWYGNCTEYIEILQHIKDENEAQTSQAIMYDLTSATTSLVAIVIFISLSFLIMPVVFVVAYRSVSSLQVFAAEIVKSCKITKTEKKTTENILLKMLPPSVAKQLKQKKPVNAEVYDSVSIFFSDVVGFTSISAKSTPMQVVAFLNQLYDFFDNVIDKYDCYKVETIGDAYMVSSGLPVRNGERHAHELSSMALDLRDGIEHMQIPHMVLHKLQLRIGMHSGPCVAGVVGNKMPRYCLFGQTVQIASKMESTGVAQKIQITSGMHDRLEKLGGHTYVTEPRDVIEIEGVGEIHRYWLVGRRTNFAKKQNITVKPATSMRHRSPEMKMRDATFKYLDADQRKNMKTLSNNSVQESPT